MQGAGDQRSAESSESDGIDSFVRDAELSLDADDSASESNGDRIYEKENLGPQRVETSQ